MKFRFVKRMLILSGLAVMAVSASAAPDVKINIDRTVNSPTLMVRYSGANASLIEIRLNGQSMGTRTADAAQASGETSFTLSLSDLRDGENEVEIRLFDKSGKPVGSQKFVVQSEQTAGSAVFLADPKVGQTVMGMVEIKLGMNAEIKNSYVSFFVDNNFKGMSNFPPYVLNWDTTREKNGWHEVEAWAVDAGSNTYKTRKVKVFINNPGGRTERPNTGADTLAANPKTAANVVGGAAGIKPAAGKTTAAKAVGSTVAPKVTTPIVNQSAAAKSVKPEVTVATGPKVMVPTGNHNAPAIKPVVAKAATTQTEATVKTAPVKAATVKPAAPVVTQPVSVDLVAVKTNETPSAAAIKASVAAMRTAATLKITQGTRLANISTFAISYNAKPVTFDVAPRVDDGVPMTPLRHLFESAGGEVKWENLTKSVTATADGQSVYILIGDPNAKVNNLSVRMESTPYLDRGRTIVPLSFLRQALKVEVEYDRATNHVLITSVKN